MKAPTRTPEGQPNRCPICGKRLRLEPSIPSRDAPCPHCGSLVWFPAPSPRQATFDQELDQLVELLLRIATERFGEPTPEIRSAIDQVDNPDELAAMTRR